MEMVHTPYKKRGYKVHAPYRVTCVVMLSPCVRHIQISHLVNLLTRYFVVIVAFHSSNNWFAFLLPCINRSIFQFFTFLFLLHTPFLFSFFICISTFQVHSLCKRKKKQNLNSYREVSRSQTSRQHEIKIFDAKKFKFRPENIYLEFKKRIIEATKKS